MIIDQLPSTVSDNLTDEVPVEQGQLTFKTTWQKIKALFLGTTALPTTAQTISGAIAELDSDKQDTLVSGTNIKTVGGSSLLGSGDVSFKTIGTNSVLGSGDISFKTVGGVSIFGSGDIPAGGGSALALKDDGSDNLTVNSGSRSSAAVNVKWSGHTPIGIVGCKLEDATDAGVNSYYCATTFCYISYSGTTPYCNYGIYNHGSSTAKVKFTATVLYTVD